jgi:glucose/arabinose dehydrogenase
MKKAIVSLALVGFLPAALSTAVEASTVTKSEKHSFRVVELIRPLKHPWSIAWLPDGRLLITERSGTLRIASKDFRLDPKPIEGLPEIRVASQGGLFDVAVHPDYRQNGWIYLSFAEPGSTGSSTALIRGKLEGNRLVKQERLFGLEPKTNSGHHFGGKIVLTNQGVVYLTLGDRGAKDRAQRLDDHAGSVIRLHDDGKVPRDNPFVSQKDARPEIFSYGHRNIQGAAVHPQTGELWTHEHGPQGGDEINISRAGKNYGWPVITYGVNYVVGTKIGEGTEKSGMEQPLYQWTPSIAVSGLAFYQGNAFPQWQGNLFVGALRGSMLVRLELDGNRVTREERLLQGAVGRIRDVRVGPDGLIYFLTDHPEGSLYRIEPVTLGR